MNITHNLSTPGQPVPATIRDTKRHFTQKSKELKFSTVKKWDADIDIRSSHPNNYQKLANELILKSKNMNDGGHISDTYGVTKERYM